MKYFFAKKASGEFSFRFMFRGSTSHRHQACCIIVDLFWPNSKQEPHFNPTKTDHIVCNGRKCSNSKVSKNNNNTIDKGISDELKFVIKYLYIFIQVLYIYIYILIINIYNSLRFKYEKQHLAYVDLKLPYTKSWGHGSLSLLSDKLPVGLRQ